MKYLQTWLGMFHEMVIINYCFNKWNDTLFLGEGAWWVRIFDFCTIKIFWNNIAVFCLLFIFTDFSRQEESHFPHDEQKYLYVEFIRSVIENLVMLH